MNMFSIKSQSLCILSTCLMHLVTFGLPWFFFGCASSEMVRIPAADSTPPTVSMTIIIELATREPKPSKNILLDQNSTAPPVEYLRNIGDGISIVADGTDADGGIKNIEIISSIKTTYSLPNGEAADASPAVARGGNPSNAQVGESTSIQRITSYVYKMPDSRTLGLPAGSSRFQIHGKIYAEAKNFHGGSVRTPDFEFVFPVYD